jgi:diguanylate cyclase (GGDEF)-like protein
MGDVNGLKVINDTVGHLEGDKLLKIITQILKDACKEGDLVCRIGGDEFIILIPNMGKDEYKIIINKIFESCKNYKHELINISIALGASTTNNLDKNIYETLKEAEDKVYRQKLLQENSINSSIMHSLKAGLQAKSLETEEHTERVLENAITIGEKLSLSMSEMDELLIVANLHDIGKIGVSEEILLKPSKLTDEEFEIIKTHTEKGYRIVKASNQLDGIARGVLTHHERWDGNGYPLKLKGEDIPLVARIVCVADSYDVMTHDRTYKKAMSIEEAIEELKICSGRQFDPKIVSTFIEYLEENKAHERK